MTKPNQRGVSINCTVLRVLLQEREFTKQSFASAVGVKADTVHRWLFGETRPGKERYLKICETLEIAPQLLRLSSSELVHRGQHARVARFWTKEMLGLNDAPTHREIQCILDDIQAAGERETAEAEVRAGEITLFGADEPAPDREFNPFESDAESEA